MAATLVAAVAAVSAAPVEPPLRDLCTVTDPRLAEFSGLVVTGPAGDPAFWAMSDGGRDVEVHRIDPRTCAVLATRTADIDPFDAEDLAQGPDGALWVSDTGDNNRQRATVAVIELPAHGGGAQLHRLTYPDGPHDAEALLVDGQGRPVIVTKEGDFGTGAYRTAAAPQGTGPTPLERIGSVTLPVSDTPGGPLGTVGSRVVTGAAATADGQVVALRSYTDAWLYRVKDGDVAGAFTGPAVRVPLPDEPQGEALAFGADGTLYSGSEARSGRRGVLRAVPHAAALVDDPAARRTAPATPPGSPDPVPVWRQPAVLGGGVVVGLLALLTAAVAVRGRRRR